MTPTTIKTKTRNVLITGNSFDLLRMFETEVTRPADTTELRLRIEKLLEVYFNSPFFSSALLDLQRAPEEHEKCRWEKDHLPAKVNTREMINRHCTFTTLHELMKFSGCSDLLLMRAYTLNPVVLEVKRKIRCYGCRYFMLFELTVRPISDVLRKDSRATKGLNVLYSTTFKYVLEPNTFITPV